MKKAYRILLVAQHKSKRERRIENTQLNKCKETRRKHTNIIQSRVKSTTVSTFVVLVVANFNIIMSKLFYMCVFRSSVFLLA